MVMKMMMMVMVIPSMTPILATALTIAPAVAKLSMIVSHFLTIMAHPGPSSMLIHKTQISLWIRALD
jgi:hypothetical protein